MASNIVVVDATGISAPTYGEVLQWLQDRVRAIYGTDIYIEPDSQDGQLLAIFALALHDSNSAAVAVFNSFSPSTAQGVGLSSVVKINGIKRQVPSFSQVVVRIVGQAGTQISNGRVGDNINLNSEWALPATVEIPPSGEIDVTATSTAPGAITAAPNSVQRILTPSPGWQTVTNPASAAPGAPVESDANLRRRQTKSTSISALTPREAIYAAVANVTGVQRLEVFENENPGSDERGLPPHSIAVVVEGGDLLTVAETVALKKSPGTGTFGSSKFILLDSRGVPNTINVSSLNLVPIYFDVTILPLKGYVSTTGDLILSSVAEFLNEQTINEELYVGRLWAPANLSGTAAVIATGLSQIALDKLSLTFTVRSITVGVTPGELNPDNVTFAFDESAFGSSANGTVTIL
jgi:hypothetical protein